MPVDQAARARLGQMQMTRDITASIEKLSEKMMQTTLIKPVAQTPAPAKPIAPIASSSTNELVTEFRNLQRVIGGGNLNQSLARLIDVLDKFELDEEATKNLQSIVAELTVKVRMLAELSGKLPEKIRVEIPKLNVDFPKQMQVEGSVDVGSIDHLPPVTVSNLAEVTSTLSTLISRLQETTIKAIAAAKVEVPDTVKISNQVQVVDFSDLLDGIEELKKGFNLLINKEVGEVRLPDGSIPVEIQNWMIPQPVTNVSINSLRGAAKTTAVTVTTSATALPASALSKRRSLIIYNNSAVTVEIGGSSLTYGTGLPIPAGSYSPAMDAGDNLVVYGIVNTGTADVRVLEVSDGDSGR